MLITSFCQSQKLIMAKHFVGTYLKKLLSILQRGDVWEVKGLRGICLSQLLVPISSCWGYFVLGSRTGRLSLLSHSLPQCRPEAATPCNKWHRFQQNSPPHFSWFLAQISNFAQWPGSKTATGERKWASLQLPRLPIPIPLLLWPAVPEEEIIIKVDMGLTDITIYNYVVFRL